MSPFLSVRPRGADTPIPATKPRKASAKPGRLLDVNGRPVVSLERRPNSLVISNREQSAAQVAKSRKISLSEV